MPALLERNPTTPEALQQPTTRTKLARAALRLLEIIPRPKPIAEKPKHINEPYEELPDTGSHHIKNPDTDLRVDGIQAQLATEAKWKEEFDALLPKTAEEQKQRLYEQALYDPTVLVAPEPELKSKTVNFSSTDKALLDS